MSERYSGYSQSHILRIRRITVALATAGKRKSWLAQRVSMPRAALYDVLNGWSPINAPSAIEKMEATLGIAQSTEFGPIDDELWAPAPEPLADERAQILRALAGYSRKNLISRRDLLNGLTGNKKNLVDALNALIAERLVMDVIVTRGHRQPAVVYVYPAGQVADKWTFRKAKAAALNQGRTI